MEIEKAEASPDGRAAGAAPEAQKANILIVDDREENLKALAAVLAELGENVLTASSGQEALRVAFGRELAVILLDVRMPGMNGIEVAQWIRSRKRSRYVPIIFITAADARPDEIARAYSAGAVDYIFKPFAPEVLKAKVRSLLELHRKGEELRESERRYQMLAEVSPVGIFRTNRRGDVLYVNHRMSEITGLTAPEILEQGWIPAVHPDDRDRVVAELAQATKDGKPFAQEYRFLRKDGESLWVFGQATRETSRAGEPLGFIGTLTEITKRKLAEEELRASKAALEESFQELETFSYSVSHDLRAPLRSMHRFSDILLEERGEALGPEGRDYAQRIAGAARQMDALIQDLLTYGQLGKRELKVQPVSLSDAVCDVLGQMEGDISERNAEVVVDGSLPVVHGDAVLLAQALTNLVSNAIKFVAPGVRPRVRVVAERLAGGVRLWVEDNGIGIPEEYFGKLFRVFERLVRSTEYPGTGIGLAIVRRAVERMGGRAGVESVAGKGSRFWIELPPAEAP